MTKFIKLSQVPEAPAAPPPMPVDPMAGMGMPPLGMPMGVPPPVQPMSSPPDRMEITKGLDTLGEILYDVDVTEMISNQVGENLEDITMRIWEMYGGDAKGNANEEHVGARSEEPLVGEASKKELKRTKNSRWRRLPRGKVITDICEFDELSKVMQGLAMGTIKSSAQEAAGGAGGAPGGLPPMMASYLEKNIRIATALDLVGLNKAADYVDFELFKFLK
jgi:hypothetical protein